MSPPPAKLSVSVGEKTACIKISGRANFTSSIDFKTLINELLQRRFACFALDLTECTLMDSTFLGVLAGFGLKVNSPQTDGIARVIQLFNPNPRIAELLETLGVLHLFQVHPEPLNVEHLSCPVDHQPSLPNRQDVTENCLEAHQTLMSLNPGNASRFKDVAAFLAEDLKRMKAG